MGCWFKGTLEGKEGKGRRSVGFVCSAVATCLWGAEGMALKSFAASACSAGITPPVMKMRP